MNLDYSIYHRSENVELCAIKSLKLQPIGLYVLVLKYVDANTILG